MFETQFLRMPMSCLAGALCLFLAPAVGCGPSQEELESEMPSTEEVEISVEEDAAMTAEHIGGEEEESVDGSCL
jgi:hypothetical protein